MAKMAVSNELDIPVTEISVALKHQLQKISHVFFPKNISHIVQSSWIGHICVSITTSDRIILFSRSITFIRPTKILIQYSTFILLSSTHTNIRSLSSISPSNSLITRNTNGWLSSVSTITIDNIIQLFVSIKPFPLLPNAPFEQNSITMAMGTKVC